jgi:hypothetical protein
MHEKVDVLMLLQLVTLCEDSTIRGVCGGVRPHGLDFACGSLELCKDLEANTLVLEPAAPANRQWNQKYYRKGM